MKKLFIAALLAISVASSAFAADVATVKAIVLNNFKHDFERATEVSWKANSDYAKATFILDHQKMEVFYNSDGDIIGTSKAISLDELPVKAKRTFAQKFDGYTVKEAIRFEGNEDAAYFISAENEKESVVLKVADNSQVSIFKKDKK